MKGTELINKLMTEAFHPLRNPRSHEYRTGARAVLERQINGKRIPAPPKIGTAQADAWFAGVDEGWAIWRRYQEQQTNG